MIDFELRVAGTSPAAIAHHYDLSDDFFAIWLGDDLVYSCALWNPDDPDDPLEIAQQRKLDFFANELAVRGKHVLDIGCGWGALLDRFATSHGLASGVGLTLSQAQAAFAKARNVPDVEYLVRVIERALARSEFWTKFESGTFTPVISCFASSARTGSLNRSS